jgi:hypothetical protein
MPGVLQEPRPRGLQRLIPGLGMALALGCGDGQDSALIGQDPAGAAASFSATRGHNDFAMAFSYGEASSGHLGLEAAVERGLQLPEHARQDFFDGAAHGWTAPMDQSVTAIEAELQATVPRRWLNLFDGAVARSWTEQLGGQPTQVVPRIQAWRRATGKALPLDGVRVGLQRSQGDQLSTALKSASRYPDEWQPALFEELGWRAGNDLLRWHVEYEGFLADTPEKMRCVFVHGAVRGRLLHAGVPDAATGRKTVGHATATAPHCSAAAWQGLAWALALREGDGAEQAALDIALPERDAVIQTLRTLRGARNAPPWIIL